MRALLLPCSCLVEEGFDLAVRVAIAHYRDVESAIGKQVERTLNRTENSLRWIAKDSPAEQR